MHEMICNGQSMCHRQPEPPRLYKSSDSLFPSKSPINGPTSLSQQSEHDTQPAENEGEDDATSHSTDGNGYSFELNDQALVISATIHSVMGCEPTPYELEQLLRAIHSVRSVTFCINLTCNRSHRWLPYDIPQTWHGETVFYLLLVVALARPDNLTIWFENKQYLKEWRDIVLPGPYRLIRLGSSCLNAKNIMFPDEASINKVLGYKLRDRIASTTKKRRTVTSSFKRIFESSTTKKTYTQYERLLDGIISYNNLVNETAAARSMDSTQLARQLQERMNDGWTRQKRSEDEIILAYIQCLKVELDKFCSGKVAYNKAC